MSKSSSYEVKRGQTIAFRLPADTPDHILKQLQKLRETERRNFSGRIAEFVMQGAIRSLSQERETLTIPLPYKLSKAQRSWLKHEHSEALLGSILYQLINDPLRSTALLASLNSNSTNIDEALYLQEDVESSHKSKAETERTGNVEGTSELSDLNQLDDDLDNFEWDTAKQAEGSEDEDVEQESIDDLLGEFLAHMNK